MIKPFQAGDLWLIGRFSQHLPIRRNPGEPDSFSPTESFEKCWTGSDWSPQTDDGKTFETEAAAKDYLELNIESLRMN